jgi:membrane protein DedA with SNARE-associated domain
VFATASAIGATLWVSYATLLGYLGGQLVQQPGISLLFSLGVAAALGFGITFALKHQTSHEHQTSQVA